MKKFVSLMILLALCVSILPLNAFAYVPCITVNLNGVDRQLYLNSQWLDRALVVYGTPQDVFDYDADPVQSYDDATGEWRYLGFTQEGFPFSNMAYPNDATSDVARMDRKYVAYPWNEPSIGCPRNEQPISEYQWTFIQPQLEQLGYPPALTDYSSRKTYWSIQFWPSSSGGFEASLREWHWVNGEAWYETQRIQFPEGVGVGSALIIEPPTATVVVGEATDYKAYLDYAGNGRDYYDPEVTTDCVWNTANTSIGTIDRSQGRALGKSAGQTGVTASYIKDGYNLSGAAVLIVVGVEVPPSGKDNLSADSIELLNTDLTTRSGNVEVNKPYKVRARFSSTFDEAGWVKLRLYSWREAGWMDTLKTEYVYMQPNSTIEKLWDYNGGTEKIILYATINYRYGTPWEGETYNGVMEKNYLDNEKHLNVTGSTGYIDPPKPEGYEYSLYYHPVRYHERPIIERQPVIGWKKAKFIKDDTEYRVRVHLVIPE